MGGGRCVYRKEKKISFENLYAISPGTVTGRVTLGNWNRTDKHWWLSRSLLFNKTNRRTNFSKFIFVKKLYMFRAVSLPIIRSLPLYCRFHGIFQARPGWTCLKDAIKPAWHIPVPKVQWQTPDDGQRNCPKHVEFLDKNKFWEISASVGFIKKKFVTMHGDMNVKFVSLLSFVLPLPKLLDFLVNVRSSTLYERVICTL